MQRLVHVRLRHGDIILEASRNGLIHLMDHAQGRIAVLHRIHNDPDRKQIIDLIQRFMLVFHLFINTEEMLDPSVQTGLDAGILHVHFHFFHDLADIGLPLASADGNFIHQVVVDLRLQIF